MGRTIQENCVLDCLAALLVAQGSNQRCFNSNVGGAETLLALVGSHLIHSDLEQNLASGF